MLCNIGLSDLFWTCSGHSHLGFPRRLLQRFAASFDAKRKPCVRLLSKKIADACSIRSGNLMGSCSRSGDSGVAGRNSAVLVIDGFNPFGLQLSFGIAFQNSAPGQNT